MSAKSERIAPEVIEAISSVGVSRPAPAEWHVVITQQLDPKLYKKVDVVLREGGGKWNRTKKAHVFSTDPDPFIQSVLGSGEMVSKKANGFFETPPTLARRLVELARLEPGQAVLEPSAGQGALAEAIMKAEPKAVLDVCEILEPNREILARKGFYIAASDFFELKSLTGSMPFYHRIIMNPPFTRGADVKHVLRAWEHLLPGGRLVAIVSAGPLSLDRLEKELGALYGAGAERNPSGSFKAAGTNVETVTVVYVKPENWSVS